MRPARPNKPSELPENFVAGNYFDKYRTRNPFYRLLVDRFLRAARELYDKVKPARILEVGCGAGDLAARLLGSVPAAGDVKPSYLGTDVSPEEIAQAQARYPGRKFQTANICSLPFADGTFDLVVACEVLEHLEIPETAIREINRVCRGHVLASVPWEPWWRMLNLFRGQYLGQWGNTPGHIQHFSFARFRRLISGTFELGIVRRPLPWTMVLARTRSAKNFSGSPAHG